MQTNRKATIHSNLLKEFNNEQQYWQDVLKRVIRTIIFLGSRGLAFRGDDEILGSQHNGNYLGLLEYLAEYDPFLKGHLIKYGNIGRGINIVFCLYLNFKIL